LIGPTHVESGCLQRLKINCDELLSIFAFCFNLRHYSKGDMVPELVAAGALVERPNKVGLCRLTLSNPR
jgi:hypothetical protein